MANLLFFNVERGHRRPRKFRLSNNSLIDDYTDEELIFFFWLVILFVSLLCKIAKFSSTFSVSVAISVGLKFCFLAFLRGASAKTTISGGAIPLSKETKSIMGCYPRVSRV